LISVIIPTYNRAFCLERAISSVLAQVGADFELIVVDDGSTDGTRELLKPLVVTGRLRYLAQPNRGVSAARNLGIRAAQGSWLAFLDSDDEWRSGKLAAQIQDLEIRPELAVSQCQEIWIRGGRPVNPGRRHRKKEGDIFLDSVRLCLISPSAVILKAELLEEIGLFDENLKAAEDYDLWLRLTARYPVGLLDQALVIRHGGRPDQLSAQSGLDYYRVQALAKILASGLLSPSQAQAATEEMLRRKAIYEKGRRQRGGELTVWPESL
jgi:glycosyltransferase involved in cell wall biosynthesis